ncbi:MAG: ABC transporter permease [Anaerolineales bacterium]|nr:ABC transporter permease [Anaerolineales bacterium]MCB9128237.1 ABC transporter permease [Ardenticatenales bacterium]
MLFHQRFSISRTNLVSLLSLPLVVGTLLLFLAASNTLQVTADQALTTYWRSSYDILVRPQGSRTAIEEEYNLVRANFITSINGGITDAQYETIAAITDVDVAAPVSMVGYRDIDLPMLDLVYMIQPDNNPEQYAGLYGIDRVQRVNDGLEERVYQDRITMEPEIISSVGPPHSWIVLLAGVDPDQEATLVGLDKAVAPGQYFPDLETISSFWVGDSQSTTRVIPLLFNTASAFDIERSITVTRQDSGEIIWRMAFDSQSNVMRPGSMVWVNSADSREFTGGQLKTNQVDTAECSSDQLGRVTLNDVALPSFLPANSIALQADPLGFVDQNRRVNNPLRFGNLDIENRATYEVFLDGSGTLSEIAYKALQNQKAADCTSGAPSLGGESSGTYYYEMYRGDYDPEALFFASDQLLRNLPIGTIQPVPAAERDELVRSSLNKVPFDLYYSPPTILKYYPDGTPVSPPVELRPTLNRQGYLTTPPTALTTLEAARLLNNRDDYISAIRVRVGGVGALDAEAQAKIQRVAEQIVAQTGLEVDIMAGTSPKPVYVYLPGYEDIPPLGWVEEQWIQKGVTTAVTRGFRQADLLLSSAVFGVVGLFLVTSQLLSVLGRTRQWGILRALGWRATTLFRTVLQEALLLGLIAGLLALAGGFVAIRFFGMDVPLERLTLLLPVALALYGGGALYPAWRAARMAPIAAVQQGELSGRGGASAGRLTMTSYGLRHLGQQRLRTLLLLLQLTLASALVVLLGAVLLAVQGELYGNLLGQHIYTKVGPTQLSQAGLGLLLAALAVAEVLRTSVAERRREIGVLKALGWRSRTLLRAVLSEAALLGLIGGIFGAALGTGAFWLLYRQLPQALFWILPAGLLLCIAVSMVAALWPALQAARIPPAEAVRYE